MKPAKNEDIAAVVLFFVGLGLAIIAGITAVWLTGEVRVIGVVLFPTVAVASMLILYYDWRIKQSGRFRAETDERHQASEGPLIGEGAVRSVPPTQAQAPRDR